MTRLLELENDGLNMTADKDFLYIRRKREIIKYSLNGMTVSEQNTFFKKDGKARSISVYDDYLLLTDFCDLHILDKNDLQIMDSYKLGTNLSSDIWAARSDGQRVYAAVRNGKIAVVDLKTKTVEKYDITDSSFWDYRIINDRIYAGTVGGELLEIDKNSKETIRKIKLGNKNIYSVFHDNGIIYAVSQDQTIKAVDIDSFETINIVKKAVGTMASILGIYKDCLFIADSNKVTSWDKNTLQQRDIFPFPTGAWNKGAVLAGNRLIGSDFHSIYSTDLDI